MKTPLIACALALVSTSAFALTDKPNFVFILIDDMGWAGIAADGSRYYRTPNIDRLAAEGVRFTNAYAACAVCSPSRAAIMTGENPARLHLTNWLPGDGPAKRGRFDLPAWSQQGLDPKLPNLPKALRDSGYTTAAIGKWHLGAKGHSPEDCGFDLNIAGGHTGHPASYFWPYGEKNNGHRVPGLSDAGGAKGEYLTDRLTDEAVKFIGANKAKPFFLHLAHYAVHDPIQAKPEDIAAVESTPPADGQDFPSYAAMVKSVDDSVGRVLAELNKLGIADNTVVVFTSDNGGAVHFRATKNRPLRGGKGFPYEGGVRVPLIVRAPGVTKPGMVTATRVIGTDFAPTFLALAHAKPLPKTDGVDISRALRGETLPERALGWNFPHYWAGEAKAPAGYLITPHAALIAEGWKLVRWYEYGADELYDLTADPSERTDLAKQNPEKLATLRAKLAMWLKSNDAQAPVLKRNAPPAAAAETNPATAATWR